MENEMSQTKEIPECFMEMPVGNPEVPITEMFCMGYNECLRQTNAAEIYRALKGLTAYFKFMVQDPHFKEYVDAVNALSKAESGGKE